MKIEELRNCVHDLSNKLALVDGKLKKALSLCEQEVVKVELDKANKNCLTSLEILSTLKMILNEESN